MKLIENIEKPFTNICQKGSTAQQPVYFFVGGEEWNTTTYPDAEDNTFLIA